MKLTILEIGKVPETLRPQFGSYPAMFEKMFAATGRGFETQTIPVLDGAPLPGPDQLEALIIPGSPAGVYDDFAWMEPLRDLVRQVYAANIPMLGICFGHQIIADALGGEVRKSEKGWGMGRHTYTVRQRPGYMDTAPATLAVACSHQDQVITPPDEAETILASDFTPHAGLTYRNGKTLSFQPHPEFDDPYTRALVELRRGMASDTVVDTAIDSFTVPSQQKDVATYIADFLEDAGRR